MVSKLVVIAAVAIAALSWRSVVERLLGKGGFRAHNFSAGPSRLPDRVMLEAQQHFVDWHGRGMGFSEMSHRDANGDVQLTMKKTEALLRSTLEIPDNYHVLFMHGGAHGQFAAVPMNLLGRDSRKDKMAYVVTGFWSERAAGEADKYGKVVRVNGLQAQDEGLADPSTWAIPSDASFVHMCACETIHGREFLVDPDIGSDVPLVADFTSTLLSRPVNVSRQATGAGGWFCLGKREERGGKGRGCNVEFFSSPEQSEPCFPVYLSYFS